MKEIDENFIPYKQALQLKMLGFKDPCFKFYSSSANAGDYDFSQLWNPEVMGKLENKDIAELRDLQNERSCLAPLWQQAFKFFIKEYNLDKTIDNWTQQPVESEMWDKAYQYYINGTAFHPYFKTHKEAEFECLKKLIEIVKNL